MRNNWLIRHKKETIVYSKKNFRNIHDLGMLMFPLTRPFILLTSSESFVKRDDNRHIFAAIISTIFYFTKCAGLTLSVRKGYYFLLPASSKINTKLFKAPRDHDSAFVLHLLNKSQNCGVVPKGREIWKKSQFNKSGSSWQLRQGLKADYLYISWDDRVISGNIKMNCWRMPRSTNYSEVCQQSSSDLTFRWNLFEVYS